ncbi:hypothetical protein HDV03_001462, partial [Kappamyces sp. JEL0829]
SQQVIGTQSNLQEVNSYNNTVVSNSVMNANITNTNQSQHVSNKTSIVNDNEITNQETVNNNHQTILNKYVVPAVSSAPATTASYSGGKVDKLQLIMAAKASSDAAFSFALQAVQYCSDTSASTAFCRSLGTSGSSSGPSKPVAVSQVVPSSLALTSDSVSASKSSGLLLALLLYIL